MNNDQQWSLRDINISYQEWGDYKGKYVGKIRFANKENEAFSFNISEAKAHEFLALIRDSVVDSANGLGDKIAQSLPGLPPASNQITIDVPAAE